MAKMRGIKPEFWTDGKVVQLSLGARLLFIGSWHYACDHGHVNSTALELKMRVLPADVVDAEALVEEIVTAGLFERDGERFTIPNFSKHQKTDPRYLTTCERCTSEDRDAASARKRTRGTTGDPTSAHGAPGGHTAGTRSEPAGDRHEGEGEGEGEVETPTGGPGGKPPTSRKRSGTKGTRIPEIFRITPEMAEWGREHAPDVDAAREHETFCDYWRGASGAKGVKADWIATWRNWMRRAQERIDERGGKSPSKAADAGLPDWMLA